MRHKVVFQHSNEIQLFLCEIYFWLLEINWYITCLEKNTESSNTLKVLYKTRLEDILLFSRGHLDHDLPLKNGFVHKIGHNAYSN